MNMQIPYATLGLIATIPRMAGDNIEKYLLKLRSGLTRTKLGEANSDRLIGPNAFCAQSIKYTMCNLYPFDWCRIHSDASDLGTGLKSRTELPRNEKTALQKWCVNV